MPSDFNKVNLIVNAAMEKGNYSFIEVLDYQTQLGINFKENYKTRNYGDSLEYLTSFYDILGESKKEDVFDKSEQKILEIISSISKIVADDRSAQRLVNELLQETGIKNPVAIYSTINKMKGHEVEILNESLLTPDKMREMALAQMNEDNPLIYMEEEDGITKFVLQGIDYNFLAHDTYGLPIQRFGSYEGQFGNNAICARLATNKINNAAMGSFIFTSVEKESGVIAYADRDANTNHLPKLVRGTSVSKNIINNELTKEGNEVAIYRRLREHSNISNENAGGRRLPDLYRVGKNIEISMLDDETKEFLRENDIPIVYIDFERYSEINRQNQQLEHEEISIER